MLYLYHQITLETLKYRGFAMDYTLYELWQIGCEELDTIAIPVDQDAIPFDEMEDLK